jgi:hypothetical protein
VYVVFVDLEGMSGGQGMIVLLRRNCAQDDYWAACVNRTTIEKRGKDVELVVFESNETATLVSDSKEAST